MRTVLFVGLGIFCLAVLSACGGPVVSNVRLQVTPSPLPSITPGPTKPIMLERPSHPSPTLVDTGLVYGRPCRAPCWYGLVPGQTTLTETQEVLVQLRTSRLPYDVPGPNETYLFLPPDGGMTGSVFVAIDWEKEIVESITSIGLRFEYTVEQLIDQFGEPESIYGIWIGASVAAKSCADWSPSMQSEDIGRVYLIYPQKGLLFRVNVLHGGSKLLCPQMKVSAFCYFSPLSKEHEPGISDLEHLCLNNDLRDLADQYLLQWHGFGPGY